MGGVKKSTVSPVELVAIELNKKDSKGGLLRWAGRRSKSKKKGTT